ncbi:hypothetical protein MN608_02896 [Microdochium nivale]|nr:hypothetical protein MN608_02896 [Microdochium nivale]
MLQAADSQHGQQTQDIDFRTTGLVIYRCNYSDEGLWDRYLAKIRDDLDWYHRRYLVEGAKEVEDWTWTIFQDRDTLDGATKDRVREIFTEWRNGRSSERDGPGADNMSSRFLARFTYAIHVGKDSLDSMRLYEEYATLVRRPEVVMAIVEAPMEFELPPSYAEQEEEEEDIDEYDIGWMYGLVKFYGSMYDQMSHQQFWTLVHQAAGD